MERYLGIDVHRDSSTVCILSATGKRVNREIVETNGQALVRCLRKLHGRLHVCIEESPWSEWLHELGLDAEGIEQAARSLLSQTG